MLSTAYYFLQVIICSGILLLYYWLFLRNKQFHQYNRFYLLSVGLLSWFIPLIKIPVNYSSINQPTPVIQLVNLVASNNSEIESVVLQEASLFTWERLLTSIYIVVSAILLLSLIVACTKIYKLLKTNSGRTLGDVFLIITNAKGTPFSFFKYIFLHEAIDLHSATGKQIIQHELVHVKEKHSADKLFMQLVIIVGWMNPFFWICKKELSMIHEFVADDQSIQNGDTKALAEMLLISAYPQQKFLLTNPFFFSPIKRRLTMLTQKNNPKLSYLRRLIALPLLAILVTLFAFRKKETTSTLNNDFNKVYTVVIDAGHGGEDKGAIALDGKYEKDFALLLLQTLKEVNTNKHINLVFTRNTDVFQKVTDKANFVNEHKADLFISLHLNSELDKQKNGFEIIVPNNAERKNLAASKLLGAAINQSLQKDFVSNGVTTKEKGIWILKATECPAVLLECGYLTNAKDLSLLNSKAQRIKMGQLILEGVEQYLKNIEAGVMNNTKSIHDKKSAISGNVEGSFTNENDTIKFNAIDVSINAESNSLMFKKPQVTIQQKKEKYSLQADTLTLPNTPNSLKSLDKALIIINGEKSTINVLKSLSPNAIQKMDVLSIDTGMSLYGENGKNGVIKVVTKNIVVPISKA